MCLVLFNSVVKSISEEINDTRLVVIDSFDGDAVEKLAEDTANLSIVEQQILSEGPKIVFDSTTNEYRNQQKTPVFDTGNYFGRRRILSSMCCSLMIQLFLLQSLTFVA